MIRYCPRCWAENDWEATVCATCGAPLHEQGEDFVDKLIAALHHPEPTRAGLAIDILAGFMHDTRAIEPICELIERSNDIAILRQAARALGRLGDRRAVPTLAQLLADESRPFVARQAAAEALGQLGGDEAQQALTAALTDQLATVRQAAERALAHLMHQGSEAPWIPHRVK